MIRSPHLPDSLDLDFDLDPPFDPPGLGISKGFGGRSVKKVDLTAGVGWSMKYR